MFAREANQTVTKNPTVGKMPSTRLCVNSFMDEPSPPVELNKIHRAKGILIGMVAVIAAISLLCFCTTVTATITTNATKMREISCQLISDLMEILAPGNKCAGLARAVHRQSTVNYYPLTTSNLAWKKRKLSGSYTIFSPWIFSRSS